MGEPTGNQISAARALLAVGQREVAVWADISKQTIYKAEAAKAAPISRTIAPKSRRRIVGALEAKGIRFVDGGVVLQGDRATAAERNPVPASSPLTSEDAEIYAASRFRT